MRKIKRSSELLWLFGIIFVALGVAICNKATLGVSMIAAPAFVVSDALQGISSFFSVGVVEYMLQGVLLILLCIIVRRFRVKYLLAFAVAVIYGYVLDLFIFIIGSSAFENIALRWVMLIVGDIVTAFGVSCFFRTYMPLQVYELFVAEVTKCFGFRISRVKWIFDISLLVISVALAILLFSSSDSFNYKEILTSSYHSIGIGTIATTLINSPLITLMGRLVDRCFENTPRFTSLQGLLKE